jgi:hypothetical protein
MFNPGMKLVLFYKLKFTKVYIILETYGIIWNVY